jgi:ketosteroid isomerase-like protein
MPVSAVSYQTDFPPVDFATWQLAAEAVYGYHDHVDAGDALKALDLFTTDAVVELPGRTVEGTEQLKDFLTSRQAKTDRVTMHILNNLRVVQIADDEYAVKTLTLVYLVKDGAKEFEGLIGVNWHVRKEGDRFLISRRVRLIKDGDGH